MHNSFRSPAFCTLATQLCFCLGSSAATAQVRMFHQIRGIALEEAQPGTEKPHKELSEALARRTMLMPPGEPSEASSRIWWAPEHRARCALRGDLPKPRRFGLACHDWAGRYVGTLRAKHVSEFFDKLRECDSCASRALPLSEYRYIFVKPVRDEPWVLDYVSQIVRKDGGWQVVVAPDAVPLEEAERLLYCEIEIGYGGRFPILSTSTLLFLKNIHGDTIRRVQKRADFFARLGLRAAVHRVIEERRADEEIYGRVPEKNGT